MPTKTLRRWLQAVVEVNPLTNVADALRAPTLDGPTTGSVLASLAWTTGILTAFSTLAVRAVRQYRRIEQPSQVSLTDSKYSFFRTAWAVVSNANGPSSASTTAAFSTSRPLSSWLAPSDQVDVVSGH